MALKETLTRLVYPHDLEPVKLEDPTFGFFLKRWKLMDDRAKLAAKSKAKKTS
jgi:hypothetical protein